MIRRLVFAESHVTPSKHENSHKTVTVGVPEFLQYEICESPLHRSSQIRLLKLSGIKRFQTLPRRCSSPSPPGACAATVRAVALHLTPPVHSVFFAFQNENFSADFFNFRKNFSKKSKFCKNQSAKIWNALIRPKMDRVFWTFWRQKKLSFWKKANKKHWPSVACACCCGQCWLANQ